MISALQIVRWAATADAQRELPRLVRRLAQSSATITQISMPAGESTANPGWDGELYSEVGDAWVPVGHSCWEVSCRADVRAKANEEYEKRTRQYPDEEYRNTRTLVFLTARKWPGKQKWIEQRRRERKWADVRAYDADDLEQWLEQSAAVALSFAEELGLFGPGVESLASYLQKWLNQSEPSLTTVAVLRGRDDVCKSVNHKVEDVIEGRCSAPISLMADSVEEAVALAAAALGSPLADHSVVVTSEQGWRFVEKNGSLQVAIAGSPQVAASPVRRPSLAVIIPFASGDMARQFQGIAAKVDNPDIRLERPTHAEFEESLVGLGIEENDARRMASLCGRSWSIFRRQRATNPAIRQPKWLSHSSVSALATVCLLGAWSGGKEADRRIVEKVSGKTYEELERELIELERLDDSPVLRIGEVWKAKSALELMALFGDRIGEAQLNRYFEICEQTLTEPDPILELPNEERYAAAIHGKVRPVSGLMLDALCDTLIKLAVRGPDVPGLAAKDIDVRIDILVRKLLGGADHVRWLSLSNHLPALAEASPNEFLSAVELSLASADTPVCRLISETGSAGEFGSRCWHAGLLWALETLAWAPQRLLRISRILAALTKTTIQGNWGNTPAGTLVDVYRSWFPQTAATVEQRIATLTALAAEYPDATFELANKLVNVGHDTASPIARPKWRDEDAGAGHGTTVGDRNKMLQAAADLQIELSTRSAARLGALIQKYRTLDPPRRRIVLKMLSGMRDASDQDKETLRAALRSVISWHRNYDDAEESEVDAYLSPLERAYKRLQPEDLLIRHGWLVESGWPNLPIRTREDNYEERNRIVSELTTSALREIFDELGCDGLIKLAQTRKAGWRIGLAMPELGFTNADIGQFILQHGGELESTRQVSSMIGGLLHRLDADRRETILDEMTNLLDSVRDKAWFVRLLALCPEGRPTWDRAETLGRTASREFWSLCHGSIWVEDQPKELRFAIKKLIASKRGVTALHICHGKFGRVPPKLLFEMLQSIIVSDLTELRNVDSHWLIEAIKVLEKSKIDRMELARLEFAILPLFGFEGEQHALALYQVILTEPGHFVELLCRVYKPQHGSEPDVTGTDKATAELAWRVLHNCKHQPGIDATGKVNPTQFAEFVAKARDLAREHDRLLACDITLGEIFARSPAGADGVFPFEPARDALENYASADMFSGFRTGCFNKRGVHSRGVFDGGEQERELAEVYRNYAAALATSHPRVSEALMDMCRSYERHGLMEDLEAKLRREG